jgi:hypothetical protein
MIFIVALLSAVAGYLLGDPMVVLNKAVNVCLECIGVG